MALPKHDLPASLIDLKIIGVEEHTAVPHLMSRFPKDDPVIVNAKEIASGMKSYFKAVIDTYYRFPASDNASKLKAMLAGPGWGWHSEVAIHILRLAVSGTLDRHPKLKIVIGHQGEMLPMMLRRAEEMFDPQTFGNERTVAEMLRSQVWIAISGFFTIPETLIAIQRCGIDKVLFACDYPFVQAEGVPKFVKALSEVIAPEDVKKICQTNAEALFKIKA